MGYNPLFKGRVGGGSSRSIQTSYVNSSGGTLAKATVVGVDTSGNLVALDVTSEPEVDRMVGLTTTSILNTASGAVINSGRLEDITTGFAIGDFVYAGLAGTLINVRPDIGVSGFASGNFVVFLGVIVKNQFDGAKKDLSLNIQVFGQLL